MTSPHRTRASVVALLVAWTALPFGVAAGSPLDFRRTATQVSAQAGRYTPLNPVRILDTRYGLGGISTPVGAGSSIDVQVGGRGGVPASGVAAVAMNVTVTQPTTAGYLTLFATGAPRPFTSNLNFRAGQTVANLAVLPLGTGTRVTLFNAGGNSHVIFDVAGWYSDASVAGTGGRYNPAVPTRIVDTRFGIGGPMARLGPGASLDVRVGGQGGVPASGAAAAVLNLAVTNPSAASYLTVYPTGQARPEAANLNFVPGDTVSNRVMVKLGAGGSITVHNPAGSTDVIVDVGGWYTDPAQTTSSGGAFTAVPPTRVLDTRFGNGAPVGAFGAGDTIDVQVTGRGGVPAQGVAAVILNVTVTDPAQAGFLTMFAAGATRTNTSDLNYAAGETRGNLVVVPISPQGAVSVFTARSSHVIFDVAGWSGAPPPTGGLGARVSGNRLISPSGADLKLYGVNRSGPEYACVQGFGPFDGPSDATMVAAIASWKGTNTVRVALNEQCWLGINGFPNGGYSAAQYRQAIVDFVARLHAQGLYAILELHWSAPGSYPATRQEFMPDADHTPAFWTSVANTFKNDPATLFDVFNEPTNVSWACWRDGCPISTSGRGTWQVAGMQSLVNAVRNTGATNVILLGGLQYANDLTGWLTYKPNDPLNQLMASFHVYNFNPCNTASCWTSQLGPVAAQVPLIAGEIGEDTGTANFINGFMAWADARGIGYLGWTWNTWGCGGPVLISNYNGTPCPGFGVGFKNHLATLP